MKTALLVAVAIVWEVRASGPPLGLAEASSRVKLPADQIPRALASYVPK
jgi:hypothetical protein